MIELARRGQRFAPSGVLVTATDHVLLYGSMLHYNGLIVCRSIDDNKWHLNGETR